MKPIKLKIGIMHEATAKQYERIGLTNVVRTDEMLNNAFKKVAKAFHELNKGQLFSGDSVEMTVTLKYIPEDK